MSPLLQLKPKPKQKPAPIAIMPSRPFVKRSTSRLATRRRSRSLDSRYPSKLQKFKQRSSIDMLKQSVPLATHEFRLTHRLYVQQAGRKVALSAHRIGSLAVVSLRGQGYQLYSWELRSPISSLLFETMEYCCEAAAELGQRFDIDSVLRLQPFGAAEKVDAMIEEHQMREQVAMGQGMGCA